MSNFIQTEHMRTSRFTETQILAILKEYEAGVAQKDLCRQHGINKNTLYNWKNKYSGMTSSDMRRLKELEDENSKLKKLYANVSLENDTLKDFIQKKL